MKASNIRAEAFADQVRASIRDGKDIPEGPIVAAAARTIRPEQLPSSIRQAAEKLLDEWAKNEGVDRCEI